MDKPPHLFLASPPSRLQTRAFNTASSMATAAAVPITAPPVLVEWVRGVLGELRPFVRTEVFDHWLRTNDQGGVEDKPQIIADALQALWDTRSPTHLPVKLLGRRENAFLETVFFLKTTLAEDEKFGLSLFIRVR